MELTELVVKLREIKTNPKECTDAENWHADADDLLLEYINNEQVTEAFNSIERWYA